MSGCLIRWLAVGLATATLAVPVKPARAADEEITVVARFYPAPGREDELEKRLVELSRFVRRDDPRVLYRVHRSKSTPVLLLLYETFPSREALERQASEVFPAFQKLHGAPPEGIVTRPVEREEFRRVADSPNIRQENTMQFMLMFYETGEDFARRGDKRAEEYWAGWRAYIDLLNKSGIVKSGAGLQPAQTATSLRMRANSRKVQDGPFAETKEQLGGFFIIETATLDEALEWAARAPCASSGGVEVRPVLPPRPR